MSRLAELNRKVDAFFARVSERHGQDMQCATGCSDCCHVRLTVTEVEAAAIRDHVASWPEPRRRDLAATGPADRCAALDAAGRCKIYNARPLVCRSHGVPIRLRRPGEPPEVNACFRNFTRTAPDADCILDQTTLSATLLAVDAAAAPPQRTKPDEAHRADRTKPDEARPQGRGDRTKPDEAPPGSRAGPGSRVELSALLADLAAI